MPNINLKQCVYLSTLAIRICLTLTIISLQRLEECFRSNFDKGSGRSFAGMNSAEHTLHFLHRMWHRVPHSLQALEGLIPDSKR